MLDEMTPQQFDELWAYCELVEPIGEDRHDLRAAVTTSALLSAWSGKEVSPQDVLDVLRQFDAKEEQFASPDAAAQMFAGWVHGNRRQPGS